MQVLVTGGAGFIGSNIVDTLVETGHSVVVFDDFSSGYRENLNRAARVVECSSLTASGMAAASTAELGRHESGWTRGTREGVLLERASQVLANVEDIPTPSRFDPGVALTVFAALCTRAAGEVAGDY